MSPLPRISTDETSSLPGETIHPFLRFLQAHCSLCQCLMPGVRQQDILPRSAAGIPEQFPASLWNARTAVQMLSDAPAGRIKKGPEKLLFLAFRTYVSCLRIGSGISILMRASQIQANFRAPLPQ